MRRPLAIGFVVWLGAMNAVAQKEPPDEPAPLVDPPDASPDDLRPALQKVALVIVGDPDSTLERGADKARTALTGQVRFPSDPALEAGLRGAAKPEDGLDRLRAERRSLGLNEAADIPTLIRLGELVAADLLLLVRKEAAEPSLVVFHVGHNGYLAGALPLEDATAETIRNFVKARSSEPKSPDASNSEAATTASHGGKVGVAVAKADASPEIDEESNWFEEYWPFLVGGVLLVGVIVWFALPDDDEAGPPTLRFVPGG